MKTKKQAKPSKDATSLLSLQKEVEEILLRIKKERNQLESSFKALEFFLDNLNEGVVIFDEKRNVLLVNKIALQLYGYTSREEFVKDKPTKIKSTDLETGKPIPFSKWPSARILKGEVFNSSKIGIENIKDGRKWIESYSGKLIENNGEKFIVATVRDVTEEVLKQKKAERTILESQKKYQDLIETTNDFIWEIDKSGRYTYCSPQSFRIWGIKPEEMVGKNIFSVISGRKIVALKAFTKLIKSPKPFAGVEYTTINSQGKLLVIEVSGVPFFNEKGKLLGYRGISRDVTERKKLEQQKDEFISIASHELKTPITSIKAFTQVLEKKRENGGEAESNYFLQRINKQLNKLNNLINDLLDVSKISAGKLNFNMKKFNVSDLINKTISDFQYTADSHLIKKEGDINEKVFGDKDRIQQVLINLITNAIKYSPNSNKVNVEVSKNKENIKVKVKDFGVGIPKKHQEKIFEKFFRTEKKQSRNISGFGMGLYISKEIINRHNGKIWVEKSSSKGTTISFTLPISKS